MLISRSRLLSPRLKVPNTFRLPCLWFKLRLELSRQNLPFAAPTVILPLVPDWLFFFNLILIIPELPAASYLADGLVMISIDLIVLPSVERNRVASCAALRYVS